MPKPKVPRSQFKPGEIACDHCTARCCRYFALPIDEPETRDDYDHMRWYLMHGDVSIFVDDDTWFLMVHADCKHIMPDNRCGIYPERPGVCRSYSEKTCEYDDDGTYDRLFETPEQLWEYAEAVLPPRRRKPARRPVELPVLV